jgi:hypothetical protein
VCSAAYGFEFFIGYGLKVLELFGVSTNGPGLSARPRGEGRVALLTAWTAVMPIYDVKYGLMNPTSTYVIRISSFTVVEDVLSGCFGVSYHPM